MKASTARASMVVAREEEARVAARIDTGVRNSLHPARGVSSPSMEPEVFKVVASGPPRNAHAANEGLAPAEN